MGRPSHKPTPQTIETVETLALGGYTHVEIATAIGIDPNTLRKHYKEQLTRGKFHTTAKACSNLYRAIDKGDWQATKFWLQTRGGFVQQVGHNDGSERPIGAAIFPNMAASVEEWERMVEADSS